MSDYCEALERARGIEMIKMVNFLLIVLVLGWLVPDFAVGLTTTHCRVFQSRPDARWAFPGTALACGVRLVLP